jgi:hypothetical protein
VLFLIVALKVLQGANSILIQESSSVYSCDGMKSFSNWRWADRKVCLNVPADPVSACNMHGWPKVQKVR